MFVSVYGCVCVDGRGGVWGWGVELGGRGVSGRESVWRSGGGERVAD